MPTADRLLLVGDNPFHGVSHLSQARARARRADVLRPEHAADIVLAALENGASGFLFSVNDTTLAILRLLGRRRRALSPGLYAIVPYSYGYVRSAIALGGVPGLARKVGGEIARSRDWRAITQVVRGAVTGDPRALLRAYLSYELSRVRAMSGARLQVASVLLHEVVTDLALALDMAWLFEAFIATATDLGVTAGFDTRNLPYLVRKFRGWGIDPQGTVIAAPFNPVGFQMCPSREAYEGVLGELDGASVIGFSVLAAGYLSLDEAARYVVSLSRLAGVAIGISSADHARQTFRLFREAYRQQSVHASHDRTT